MHSCVPLTKYMISLMSQMNLVDHMILGFVHYTHIICHEWPSCDKGGKGKKLSRWSTFCFLSGTDANTYADKSMNIFSSGENLHRLLHQDVEKAGEVTKSCQSLRGRGVKMRKQYLRLLQML